jgi:hypothetical protein
MSFSADIGKFCKKYDADIKTVVRKISFEAFSRIILRTPVDTGRARANWGIGLLAPNTTLLVESEDKSGTATLQKTAAGVESWACTGSIFLTNNLPYIGVLEYGGYPNPPKVGTRIKGKKFGSIKSVNGYSLQAPQGMVRITVTEMERWVASMVKGA